MTIFVTHVAPGGVKSTLTAYLPLHTALGSRPRAAVYNGTAELAMDPDLRLPLLLPEYQPCLEAKCRGVSSLSPEQVCAFAMSPAGPDPPNLSSLGLSSFGKFSPTLVLSESTPIFLIRLTSSH